MHVHLCVVRIVCVRLSYLIKMHAAINGILQLIHLWICRTMHVLL